MIDIRNIVRLALESLPTSDLSEQAYHDFIDEMKEMTLDLEKMQEYTTDERVDLLILEHAKLKLLLEDLCDIHHSRIRIPHRCPICIGSTFGEEGSLCIPCDGKGIVWG